MCACSRKGKWLDSPRLEMCSECRSNGSFVVMTKDSLCEEDIFFGLGVKPEIIDYVISSFDVDEDLILKKFSSYIDKLQVHCSLFKAKSKGMNYDWLHIHEVPDGGIWHCKFILVTTPDYLRLIITSANMVIPMCSPYRNNTKFISASKIQQCILEQKTKSNTCINDFCILTLKRRDNFDMIYNRKDISMNLELFEQFLDTYNIQLTMRLDDYDWSNVPFDFIVSIPEKKITHFDYFNTCDTVNIPCMIALTSSVMTQFNIRRYLNLEKCIVLYPNNLFDNKKDGKMGVNEGNVKSCEKKDEKKEKGIKENEQKGEQKSEQQEKKQILCFMINSKENPYKYELREFDNHTRYHVKRYKWQCVSDLITNKVEERFMFTSANFTSSAWNAKNVELGIVIKNQKFIKEKLNTIDFGLF